MLSLVIPTYKEAQNMDLLLPQIVRSLSNAFPGLQIIIVDDDSRDGISEVVEEHNKSFGGIIKLKVRTGEKGLASAWKEGIKLCETPLVGVLDADLAHDPNDLLRMAEHLRGASLDMVIGSRYLPHQFVEMEGKSFLATRLSLLGQKLVRMFLGLKVNDISHSFRVFKKEVFLKVEPMLQCEGNAMMVEFTFYTAKSGFQIDEIPIQYGKRKYGATKLGILKEGLRFLRVLFNLRKQEKS